MGGGGGGVDQQKAALKLLNTPTIASNCVALHLYYICVTSVLHLCHISTSYSMLKLLITPTIANNCVCKYVAPHLY